MPFEKIPLPGGARVFDLNLIGGLLLPCQEFGPAMCQRGRGSIIKSPALPHTCRFQR
ncbi:MAG: hypothetical protein CM1200mP29_09780 [Verrucomicrobiota bacterium]|nr:MAG: hypothetical protein CM1200mP29_09780 [Verrucomicrobiota bacterium]